MCAKSEMFESIWREMARELQKVRMALESALTRPMCKMCVIVSRHYSMT